MVNETGSGKPGIKRELSSSPSRFGPGPRISIRARGKWETPQSRGRIHDSA